MLPSVAAASQARSDLLLSDEIDRRIELLLSVNDHDPNYVHVTADPKKMAYLKPLLAHYSKSEHPFTDCVHDNLKRFGPGRTEGICAVLKDTIRQNTHWRHGKGGHSVDSGSPGVAIAESDSGARHLSEREPSLLDMLDAEIGVVDHSEGVMAALEVIELLGQRCDVYRVLLGLDDPPRLDLVA